MTKGAPADSLTEQSVCFAKPANSNKPSVDAQSDNGFASDHAGLSAREAAAAARHPAAPRIMPGLDAMPEPTPHFSGVEWQDVHSIWAIVPRQSAYHAVSGYHILLDDKHKIVISKDKIDLTGKTKQQPNSAYIAACEHARHFWQGQMEVHGDMQHRVKAYAYARAFGIQVTNFKPNDSQLIEAEKIMEEIGKKTEPNMRRPTVARIRPTSAAVRPQL